MKEKFYIENYSGDYVMHCSTEESAEIFTKYLHGLNRRWCNGDSYEIDTSYLRYMSNTCYNFNGGMYGDIYTYRDLGYTILEFEDFDWSKCLGIQEKTDDFEVPEEEVIAINTFLGRFKNN